MFYKCFKNLSAIGDKNFFLNALYQEVKPTHTVAPIARCLQMFDFPVFTDVRLICKLLIINTIDHQIYLFLSLTK